ncbi:hypothetical protein FHR75_003687 [Kineococcus radiotolerans]|uniref:Uncharacterized protein n=1 Tax=Kineococcus radiotolerans TaxID=131568 RepID=A0A7W4XY74_KINRA|nr:hypothetical protein [Kineococcus radiotolerans]MBB2902851.1 hypothetical protein [Kineococcus radiotolerans]
MALHVPVPLPRRALLAGAGLLAALGLAAAVALSPPDGRGDAGTAARERLAQVARAQDAWRTGHETYTTRLEDLGLPSRGDLAIVRGDAEGFCAGAHDPGTGAVVFYSPAGGFSAVPCG